MAISPPSRSTPLSLLLLLLLTLFSLTALSSSSSSSDLVSDLLSRQSQSPSGVIHLTDHLISSLLTSTPPPRPFSLLLFFDAQQLHDKSELRLKPLKSEFSLLASSFIQNNPNPTNPLSPSSKPLLFFCDLEFRESQQSFALFAVNALPHIRLVPSTARDLKTDSIQMEAGDFSRLAESMAEFVESKTQLTVGPIHRPPVVSKKQVFVMVVGLLILMPFVVKRVLAGETLLHDPKLWLAGAVLYISLVFLGQCIT